MHVGKSSQATKLAKSLLVNLTADSHTCGKMVNHDGCPGKFLTERIDIRNIRRVDKRTDGKTLIRRSLP